MLIPDRFHGILDPLPPCHRIERTGWGPQVCIDFLFDVNMLLHPTNRSLAKKNAAERVFSQRIEPADLCWSEVKIQDSEQKYSGRNGKACLASACCFNHGWGVEMCAFGSWDCLVVLLTSSVIDPSLDDDTPWLVFYSFGFITSHLLQNCSLPMCRTSRHATWLMVPAEALIPAVLCPQKWSEHGLCDPTIIQNPQLNHFI